MREKDGYMLHHFPQHVIVNGTREEKLLEMFGKLKLCNSPRSSCIIFSRAI